MDDCLDSELDCLLPRSTFFRILTGDNKPPSSVFLMSRCVSTVKNGVVFCFGRMENELWGPVGVGWPLKLVGRYVAVRFHSQSQTCIYEIL